MCFYTVNEYAKSTYAGKRGKAVKFSGDRGYEWLRGDKYAKYVCLVFNSGFMAGKPMWFSMSEINT